MLTTDSLVRKILTIGLILITSSILLYGQDTAVLIGLKPSNLFRVNPADTLNPKIKSQIDHHLTLYKTKKDLIKIFLQENKKGNHDATKIFKKDKELKKLDLIDILVSFELGIYNEFNILFNPIFEIYDESYNPIKIACTDEQLNNLNLLETDNQLIYKCLYLGELYINDIKVYQLLDFELKNN